MKAIFHFYLHSIFNFYHHKNLRGKNMFQNLSRICILLFSLPYISDGETMETVTNFLLGGPQITADDDYSHEIKRCLLLGRKAMINKDCVLKSRDVPFPTKVHIVKGVFSSSSHVCM